MKLYIDTAEVKEKDAGLNNIVFTLKDSQGAEVTELVNILIVKKRVFVKEKDKKIKQVQELIANETTPDYGLSAKADVVD